MINTLQDTISNIYLNPIVHNGKQEIREQITYKECISNTGEKLGFQNKLKNNFDFTLF